MTEITGMTSGAGLSSMWHGTKLSQSTLFRNLSPAINISSIRNWVRKLKLSQVTIKATMEWLLYITHNSRMAKINF